MARPNPYGFRLAGIEPVDDPAWWMARPYMRRSFWREAAVLGARFYDAAREAGLDRFGRPLIPISERTRRNRRSAMGPADPNAPPLIPAWESSRTRSYLRWQVQEDGVLYFWKYDPRVRGPWGKILQYHAMGLAKGGKVRDVMGLSADDVAKITREMRAWWRARRLLAATEGATPPRERSPQRIEIHVPAGARVLPRSQRGPSPFARPGQERTTITTTRSAVTTTGPDLGAGVRITQYRLKPPPAPVPRTTFGPSKAAPTLLGRAGSGTGGPEDRAMVLDRARAILGKPVTPADLASLAGAPDDATIVRVRVAARGRLATYLEGPGWFGATTLREGEKRPVLEFDSLQVDEAYQGGGLATRIVGRMLENARRLGVGRVTTEAAAGGPNVGYRVWPRMGFDGPIPEAIRVQLPATLKAARRLRDLMVTPEGRAWWDERGSDVRLEFDLSRGSASWRAWDAYMSARR